jgi:hypothetical protein
VKVYFLDHCKSAIDGPVECWAIGQIATIAKTYVRLDTWNVVGEESDTYSINRESFSILRSALLKVKRLK